MTWRIVSVEATRVMPSRCASCVASVLLPTPVVPPMRTIKRPLELGQLLPLAEAGDRCAPSASPRAVAGDASSVATG